MLVEKSNVLEVADVTFCMGYRTLMIKKPYKIPVLRYTCLRVNIL